MMFSLVLAVLLTQPIEQAATHELVGRFLVGLTAEELDKTLGPPTCFVSGGLGSRVLAEYWYQFGDFMIRVHVTFFRERVSSARCTIRHVPKMTR